MYRINNLSRPVLTTVDEVVAKAVVEENPDIRFLLNSIEVAEERFIAPALGDSFYEDFITRKNVQVTQLNQATMLAAINASLIASGKPAIDISQLPLGIWVNAIEFCPPEYQLLWNRFLWKICAEATDVMAVTPSWLRSTAQGQQLNNPKSLTSEAGSASGDRKDVEYKIDGMIQQRVYPLLARMKKWIAERGDYPLFKDNNKKNDGISNKTGGIIFGAYDDKNPNGPDLWQPGTGRRDEERSEGSGGKRVAVPAYTPAYITRSILVYVKAAPNPNILITVGNGKKIYAEYPVGNTLTIMAHEYPPQADYAYLAGKYVNWPVNISNGINQIMAYDSNAGTFDNTGHGGDTGFVDGDYITINFQDYV